MQAEPSRSHLAGLWTLTASATGAELAGCCALQPPAVALPDSTVFCGECTMLPWASAPPPSAACLRANTHKASLSALPWGSQMPRPACCSPGPLGFRHTQCSVSAAGGCTPGDHRIVCWLSGLQAFTSCAEDKSAS